MKMTQWWVVEPNYQLPTEEVDEMLYVGGPFQSYDKAREFCRDEQQKYYSSSFKIMFSELELTD